MKFIESEVAYEINRWLSKSGEFIYGKDILKDLSTKLTKEEIIEVYEYFRDESERVENEWREDFIALFPSIKDELPEIIELTLIEEDED